MRDSEPTPPTGFEFLVIRKARLHHWHVLANLSQFAKNREAAAIVESFQHQMDLEAHPIAFNVDNAA